MKKSTKYLLFFLSCIMHCQINNAQTFPLPGATWIFTLNNSPHQDVLAEKWEYQGNDSVVSNGIIKKIKVTAKRVNPDWYPLDSTIVSSGIRHWLFSGDTVRSVSNGYHYEICNFSLGVGDSSYTPYHNSAPSWVNGCDPADSLLIFQKGFVTETGIDNADGVLSPYYKLRFIKEMDSATVRFSKRSLITESYWVYPPVNYCPIMLEDSSRWELLCYYDSQSTSGPCPEAQWFELLNLRESNNLTANVYPNPTNDILYIRMEKFDGGHLRLDILDVTGKLCISENITSTETDLDVKALKVGLYSYRIVGGRGVSTGKFVVK